MGSNMSNESNSIHNSHHCGIKIKIFIFIYLCLYSWCRHAAGVFLLAGVVVGAGGVGEGGGGGAV